MMGPGKSSWAGNLIGWFLTFGAFAVGMTLFRAPNIETAWHMIAAMAGFGHAAPDAVLAVTTDSWIISKGYVSEAFVRAWLGSHWTVVASLITAGVLAIALFIPDTMEMVDYRENEPHSNWRRSAWIFAWSPTPIRLALIVILFAIVFANLNSFTEFLYYQF